MANDVYNTSGTPDGLQRQGRVLVHSGGKAAGDVTVSYDPRGESKTSAINAIAAKYDARFDDPTYYG